MVIMKKDLRETFRTRAFYVSVGIVIFIMIMLVQEVGVEIGTLAKQGNTSAVQTLLGTLALMLSLMLMMLFCIYINAIPYYGEDKRSIESLLCTPLSLKQICLGKTLALFLPSLILGWLLTFGSIVGINQIYVVPSSGQFIMPGSAPLVAILVGHTNYLLFLMSY